MSQKQKKKKKGRFSGRKQAIEQPGTKKKHDHNMLHVRGDEAE